MSSTCEHALIFKAPPEEELGHKDPYAVEVEKLNISCSVLPVLQFEFHNLELLDRKLKSPEVYSGIVFGSPRCVQAVAKCGQLKPNWKEKSIFVVGEATAQSVNSRIGFDSEGSESGNGANLAKVILEKQIDKPLLIPRGNLSRDTIVEVLREGGVQTESIEVYRSLPHPELGEMVRSDVEREAPNWVIYFSPSAVDATLPHLRKYCHSHFDSIRWVAIGPTTKEHLEKLGLRVTCTALKPTPHHLLEAMASYIIS